MLRNISASLYSLLALSKLPFSKTFATDFVADLINDKSGLWFPIKGVGTAIINTSDFERLFDADKLPFLTAVWT